MHNKDKTICPNKKEIPQKDLKYFPFGGYSITRPMIGNQLSRRFHPVPYRLGRRKGNFGSQPGSECPKF
jgi:hypothetical protein